VYRQVLDGTMREVVDKVGGELFTAVKTRREIVQDCLQTGKIRRGARPVNDVVSPTEARVKAVKPAYAKPRPYLRLN
jgi:hypothetical protein